MTRSTTDTPAALAALDETFDLLRELNAFFNATQDGDEEQGELAQDAIIAGFGRLTAERDALLAAARRGAGDTEDAERYRFLREHECTVHIADDEAGTVMVQSTNDFAVSGYGVSLDDATDAARAAHPEEPQHA